MSSSHKTPFWGLNKYIGNDKPTMEDYNFDTARVDSKAQEHVESDLHVTAADRLAWSKESFTIASYVGDGQTWKTINVGFDPSLVIIFMVGELTNEFTSTGGQNYQQLGIYTKLGSSIGVKAATGGFQVAYYATSAPDGKRPRLNLSGKNYVYVVFR